MVQLVGLDHFELAKELLKNKLKIVWVTKLKQAQNEEEVSLSLDTQIDRALAVRLLCVCMCICASCVTTPAARALDRVWTVGNANVRLTPATPEVRQLSRVLLHLLRSVALCALCADTDGCH